MMGGEFTNGGANAPGGVGHANRRHSSATAGSGSGGGGEGGRDGIGVLTLSAGKRRLKYGGMSEGGCRPEPDACGTGDDARDAAIEANCITDTATSAFVGVIGGSSSCSNSSSESDEGPSGTGLPAGVVRALATLARWR